MSDAAIAGDGAGRRAFSLREPWQVVCLLFIVFSAALFLVLGLIYADDTQRELRLIPDLRYDQRLDFNYFYAGADMALHGDADKLYPDCSPGHYPACSVMIYYPNNPLFESNVSDYTKAQAIVRGSYFSPPGYAYVEAPLALFSFKTAYWLFTLLSFGALLAFAGLAWRAGRGIAETPLLILGVLSFRPVSETLIMGHLAIFFLLAVAGGFLLLRAGKPELAGLALALLALKPQWAILPAVFLLVRGERRALAIMLIASALIFFVPFFVAGIDTLKTYLRFIKDVADFNLIEAPHMFSWNGFLFKLTSDPVNEPLYYSLLAVTLVPLLVVWRTRDFYLGVAATVMAMLLLNNHSVWYDWTLLCAAALFMVLRAPQMNRQHRVEMWVVLLALYIASAQSIGALLEPGRHYIDWYRKEVYAITPIAFLSLVWMAALPLRERGLSLLRS